MDAEASLIGLADRDHNTLAHGAGCRPDGAGHIGIFRYRDIRRHDLCHLRVMCRRRRPQRNHANAKVKAKIDQPRRLLCACRLLGASAIEIG